MRILTPSLIMLGTLVWPGMALAIDFSNGGWSTSFDYGQECSQRGNLGNANCGSVSNDNIYWNWGDKMQGGHATEAVSAANNPNGDGGLGFRSWVGDGTNVQTGTARIDFPAPQKELWIRWYQRYQAGFAWSGGKPQYDKTIYIRSNGGPAVLPLHATPSRGFVIASQGSPEHYQADSQPTVTWTDVFGPTSDGKWHLFEIHIKMDTNSSNGIGRMWINGNLVIDVTGIDYSGGNGVVRQGWSWFEYHSNQKTPVNGGYAYVDYDDMAIWNQTPPNNDDRGNPWIGPLNGFRGTGALPKPMPPEPLEVSFYDSIEDNNFASPGWYDKTSMMLVNSGAATGSTKSIEYRFNSGATRTIR